jgi:alpha-L-fucosidase
LIVPNRAKSVSTTTKVPVFLKGYETLYAKDPRAATTQWLRKARFGLFVHLGLSSLSEAFYRA